MILSISKSCVSRTINSCSNISNVYVKTLAFCDTVHKNIKMSKCKSSHGNGQSNSKKSKVPFSLRTFLAGELDSSNLVQKPPDDKKTYRALTLANGLHALLISDLHGYNTTSSNDEESHVTAVVTSQDEHDEEEMDGSEGSVGDGEDESEGEDEAMDAEGSVSSGEDLDGSKDESGDDREEDKEDDDNEGDGSGHDDDGDGGVTRKPKKLTGKKKMSAAALAVGVGSFADPSDIPGLAHFLEHMVFMGSQKYPDENAFDAFIMGYGGTNCGSTDCEMTVFEFEVQQQSFKEGLDRFAQFFTHPLLKQDATDREVQAVHSEFQSSTNNDTNRMEQLLGSMTKPDHPLGKFMWGNEQSLISTPAAEGIDVYARLREFHSRWYSAQYMTLVVQSQETLDTLETWVREIFSSIPNNGLPAPIYHHLQDPFDTEKHRKLYKVVPLRNTHQLDIMWSLPCQLNHYRAKPLECLSWLIGHEGKGSILSCLKKKLWGSSLSSGNDDSGFEHSTTHAMFMITVSLSEEGHQRFQDVITVIFEYLEMLRREGPKEWIYNEIKTIEDNSFRFKEEVDPIEYVQQLASNMQFFPAEHVLTGDQLFYDYEPRVISDCLNLLTPDRMCVIVSSKQYEPVCNETEPWYKTLYQAEDLDPSWLTKWMQSEPRNELHLPAPNRFMAKDFTIKDPDCPLSEEPVMITDSPCNRLWYKKDTKFNVPKGYTKFRLASPLPNSTPISLACMDLFIHVIEHNLNEVAYAAYAADLSYSIRGLPTGVIIKIDGFNHTLPLLFDTVVGHIAEFDCTEELFTLVRNLVKKMYTNIIIKPEKMNRELRLQILEETRWTPVDRLGVIDHITRDDLLNFVANFKQTICIEGLVQGNFTSAEARDFLVKIRTRLDCAPLLQGVYPEIRVMTLPLGERYCAVKSFTEQNNVNTDVVSYFQDGVGDCQKLTLMNIVCEYLQEPCFDELRTRQQLGYDVHIQYTNTNGIVGFYVYVETQADKFSADHVTKQIDAFLHKYSNKLKHLSIKDFGKLKHALIVSRQIADNHMGEEVDRHWSEIGNRTYVFDRLECEVRCLRAATLKHVQDYFHQVVLENRRKLVVQVIGCGPKERGVVISDQAREPCPKEGGEICAQDMSRLTFLGHHGSTVNQEKYIKNITDFKNDLYVYPVVKILR
ncbi:PREDICTED: nardilysin-like [Priapulus caudatus]|uniref:Nardilysin-like n=1 Tax=Priapulus caudatus TaxID=37621 RepID=A0ABM1FBK8_PRICU|nr:PREDICTED: nardilysin-like [Priapulus caudatus]